MHDSVFAEEIEQKILETQLQATLLDGIACPVLRTKATDLLNTFRWAVEEKPETFIGEDGLRSYGNFVKHLATLNLPRREGEEYAGKHAAQFAHFVMRRRLETFTH